MELLIILGIVIVIVVVVIGIYNGLIGKRNRVDEAYAQIEVQLKRRWDLIPNLVSAVKGYMNFEQDVLTRFTEARAGAVAAGAQGPAASSAAENMLTGALRSLFAVVENYPDLKASQNVIDFQDALEDIENHLQMSRRYYNGAVRNLNVMVESFPSNLVAGQFGFRKAQYFELDDEQDRAVPQVEFGN